MPFYHRGSWNRQYPHSEHEGSAYQHKPTISPRYVEKTNEYGTSPIQYRRKGGEPQETAQSG